MEQVKASVFNSRPSVFLPHHVWLSNKDCGERRGTRNRWHNRKDRKSLSFYFLFLSFILCSSLSSFPQIFVASLSFPPIPRSVIKLRSRRKERDRTEAKLREGEKRSKKVSSVVAFLLPSLLVSSACACVHVSSSPSITRLSCNWIFVE